MFTLVIIILYDKQYYCQLISDYTCRCVQFMYILLTYTIVIKPMKAELSIININQKLYHSKLCYNLFIPWFIFSKCVIQHWPWHNYTIVLLCNNNLDSFWNICSALKRAFTSNSALARFNFFMSTSPDMHPCCSTKFKICIHGFSSIVNFQHLLCLSFPL